MDTRRGFFQRMLAVAPVAAVAASPIEKPERPEARLATCLTVSAIGFTDPLATLSRDPRERTADAIANAMRR